MSNQPLQPKFLLYVLFAVSGFSGLIYESIWTHYLKLFLGHSAYAQTLVLAIFMGGMAGGAYVSGKLSGNWDNLLVRYAGVEAAIGLFGLGFHPVYDAAVSFSYSTVMPGIGSVLWVNAYKWSLSTLMILPQSFLLGMTFPLMTAGFIRRFPDRPGFSISCLYFTNSLGAVLGVLASGFLLIQWVGLPGTIRFAGVINLVVAGAVWVLTRTPSLPGEEILPVITGGEKRRDLFFLYFLLFSSLVTGASSFMYEVGWIRMLSLVLGSSTHSFELMLGAFILGLALGGCWVRKRIDRIPDPVSFLAKVQIAMGVFALATLVLYGNTFQAMTWLVQVLPKTGTGYFWFNLSGNLISLYIMFPATFCAGMTLPLITYSLVKKGHGEQSIGWVYSANTLGAIAGVCSAVHVGFPLLGLKNLIILGAGLDIALGMAIGFTLRSPFPRWNPVRWATAGLAAILAVLVFVQLDTRTMSSGVYRFGEIEPPDQVQVLYHRDGKTASIDLLKFKNGTLTLKTNGKSDASIQFDPSQPPSGDELTMLMAALAPLMFKPDAKSAAVIGFGSGMTTHTLVGAGSLERVDTVEIEPAVWEASKRFFPRVKEAYTNPKSRIYFDDARTFFSTQNRKYDIIVSEPSNPWVSGISSLFTKEFYRSVSRFLAEDGVFVQWVQLYELDLGLVASIAQAISGSFSDYLLYSPNNFELLFVARKSGTFHEPDPGPLQNPRISDSLKRVLIRNVDDFNVRKIGNRKLLDPFFKSFPVPANSDYFPFLDQNAAEARFKGSSADGFFNIANALVPLLEMLEPRFRDFRISNVSESPFLYRSTLFRTSLSLRNYWLNGSFPDGFPDAFQDVKKKAVEIKGFLSDCGETERRKSPIRQLVSVGMGISSFLTADDLTLLWPVLEPSRCPSLAGGEWDAWIRLFRAVGDRNGTEMSRLAENLLKLKKDPDLDPVDYRYLLAAAMAGRLVQGDRQGCARLWNGYSNEMAFGDTLPVLFRFLLSQCYGSDFPPSLRGLR